MIPLELYLENFRNHKKTSLSFPELQSILIVGKNKNNERISNGVGKTTIFSGIEWVLYNKMNNGTLDQVIRDGQKKAIGTFVFKLDDAVYKAYRHRTTSGAADLRLYIKQNDDWEAISERTPSETEEKLKKIIKLSHKAFTYSVLFRQADLAGISDEGDAKARIKVLKEPLNLTKYTKLENIASTEVKPLKSKIDNVEGAIYQIGDPDEDITAAKKEYKICLDNIRTNEDKIEQTLAIVSKKKENLLELKGSLGQEDTDIHNKIANTENEIKKHNENISIANKNYEQDCEHEKDLLKDISILSKKTDDDINSLANLKSQIKPIDECKKIYDKVCADEIKGIDLVAGVKAELKHIKNTVPDESVCPLCNQDITDDYREHVEKEIAEKTEAKKKDLVFYETALEKCRNKKKKLEAELNEIKELKHKIINLEQTIENNKNNIQSKNEEIKRIVQRKTTYEDRVKQYKEVLENSKTHLNSLKEIAKNSSVSDLNNRIFELSDEIKKTEKELEGLRMDGANLSSKKGGLEERIKSRKEDKNKLIDLKKQLSELNFQLKTYTKVIHAFSYKGIPTNKIRNILSELQFETNKALREIRPELEVQLDSELNIEYRRNGSVREYSQLSHGQKVYIALAFKRGLSRVIQKRLSLNVKMLTFDEVDAHLDVEGIDAYKTAINKWKDESTVFVITHNNQLKDSFNRAILVEEDGDGAEAKLVDSW